MKKSKDKDKDYLVIYTEDPATDVYFERCKLHRLRDLLKEQRLHIREVAVIDGKVVKDFGQDKVDRNLL